MAAFSGFLHQAAQHQEAPRYAICAWGASYTYGLESDPELTTTQPYSNQRAVNSTDNRAGNPGTPALIPLTCWTNLEDPGTSMCNQLSFMGFRSNWIFHDRAAGGSTIFEHDQGSTEYNNQMGQIDDVVDLVGSQGVEYRAIMCMSLGYIEEVVDGLAWSTYESTLLDLLADYRSELATRTGQSFQPRFFTQQPGWWQSIGNSTAIEPPLDYAFHFLSLAQSNANIILASSTIWMNIETDDNVHPTNTAEQYQGELLGTAIYLREVLGEAFLPLHITGCVANGSTLTLDYHVPAAEYNYWNNGTPALVLDTTTTGNWRTGNANTTTHGFRYIPPGGGSARSITSVSVVNNTQIEIELDGNAEAGYTIGYADIGASPPDQPRGNLRDNWNGPSRLGFPLYHWALNQQFAGTMATSQISGSTTIALTPAAALVADGALAGSASVSLAPSAALTADGPIAGQTSLSLAPSATLVADGALAASANLSLALSGALVGDGALIATAALSVTPTGTMVGDGALSGTAAVSFTGSGTLSAEGAIAGSVSVSLSLNASLSGDGALLGATVVTFNATGELTELSSGSIDGTASFTVTPSATLVGDGALSTTASIGITGSASLIGRAPVAASTTVSVTSSGTIAGSGALLGAGAVAITASAALQGDGALSTTAAFALSANGALRSVGYMLGQAMASFSASADLSFYVPPPHETVVTSKRLDARVGLRRVEASASGQRRNTILIGRLQ